MVIYFGVQGLGLVRNMGISSIGVVFLIAHKPPVRHRVANSCRSCSEFAVLGKKDWGRVRGDRLI